MRFKTLIFTALLLAASILTGYSAAPAPDRLEVGGTNLTASTNAAHEAHGEHHGLPLYAPELFRIGPLPVTNSMLVTWGVALFLILFAQMATRNIKEIPSGAQNFWEWLVESLYEFLEGIMGAALVKRTFWFFATVFIFILFSNWFGLIPGVGTVGWKVLLADGSTEFRPFLRGGNADLNMTGAMAMVFFACWIFWVLQSNGPVGALSHIFGYHGDAKGFLKVFLIGVFLAVGLLEVISILFRPVSLSFRLFGNVFAGENLLEAMTLKGGTYFGWLIPLPFYFLELIVGLVQALVFTLLTAIFTALMCQHDHEPAHAPGEEHH